MEAVNFLSALVIFTLMCRVMCDEDFQLLNDRVDAISNRFDAIENLVTSDKAILLTKQEDRILSLKTELKRDIRKHVKTALSEILQGESFEDIIESEVVSEVRHLKRANHQMRRQLHQTMTSLGQVQEDNRVYREALMKGERENAELMTCSKFHVKSELLTVQLAERDRQISELKQKLSGLNGSCSSATNTNYNESVSAIECSKCLHSEFMTKRLLDHDRMIGELNQTLMTELSKESVSASLFTTEQYTTTLSTTTEPTTVTTQLTTPESQEERSRILVASSSSQQFYQVDINSKSLDIYSYLNLNKLISVVYISKLNSLLIGLYSPAKIISSKLHTSRVVTVRHNVTTHGMAADEKRGIIFLTTVHPSYTISRMSLQGRHYTAVVSLARYGEAPRAIAVHPDTKMIYSCVYSKLLSVRYDGSRLTTLDTGRSMRAVTLDISNSLLYYGKQKTLMKRSLSNNTSSEVAEFSFTIRNLIYYRDTVYYTHFAKLGSVDVEPNNVFHSLQTLKMFRDGYFIICLIP